LASIAGAVLAAYALKSANEANRIARQALTNDYKSAMESSASKVKPPYWAKCNDTDEWGYCSDCRRWCNFLGRD
ncbi:MAG: hypothetical protein E6493_00450, partial [Alloscardovia omnicolens]|nr:hypothetical protein [Alloscardovia omnicolens]